MNQLLIDHIQEIKQLCIKQRVANLYVFGSALTERFSDNSDIDFAVELDDSLNPIEHGEAFLDLLLGLEEILKVPVDLVSYRALKNPVFKKELDTTKVSLYAA